MPDNYQICIQHLYFGRLLRYILHSFVIPASAPPSLLKIHYRITIIPYRFARNNSPSGRPLLIANYAITTVTIVGATWYFCIKYRF